MVLKRLGNPVIYRTELLRRFPGKNVASDISHYTLLSVQDGVLPEMCILGFKKNCFCGGERPFRLMVGVCVWVGTSF